MKLKVYNYCTDYGITVDDKEFNDYSKEEQVSFIKDIISNIEGYDLFKIMEACIEILGVNEDETSPCEICGHYNSTISLEMDIKRGV